MEVSLCIQWRRIRKTGFFSPCDKLLIRRKDKPSIIYSERSHINMKRLGEKFRHSSDRNPHEVRSFTIRPTSCDSDGNTESFQLQRVIQTLSNYVTYLGYRQYYLISVVSKISKFCFGTEKVFYKRTKRWSRTISYAPSLFFYRSLETELKR